MKSLIYLSLLTASISFGKEPEKTAGQVEQVTAEMATAAKKFVSTLTEEQKAAAVFPFPSDERENWGFVPRERSGVPLKNLQADQVLLVRGLLKTALSDPGLTKVDTIMALESFLGEIEKRPEYRDPEAYFTSIFGIPSATGTWGWRFEGHHLSLNYTIVDGKKVSVTPSFFAANPGEIMIDHPMKGTRPLAAEEDLARALAVTLKESGKDPVYSEKPPKEILTAADRKAKLLEAVGISYSEMTPAQQEALLKIIEEFAHRHREELAEADIEEAKKEMDGIRFAWAGSLLRNKPYYYRIQGQTFLIEVANVQNKGNHIHAVWRDRENDFGQDILGDHIHHDH